MISYLIVSDLSLFTLLKISLQAIGTIPIFAP